MDPYSGMSSRPVWRREQQRTARICHKTRESPSNKRFSALHGPRPLPPYKVYGQSGSVRPRDVLKSHTQGPGRRLAKDLNINAVLGRDAQVTSSHIAPPMYHPWVSISQCFLDGWIWHPEDTPCHLMTWSISRDHALTKDRGRRSSRGPAQVLLSGISRSIRFQLARRCWDGTIKGLNV
jgi:hypothetical protein